MWMGDGSTRVALHVGLTTQRLQRQWLHTAWEPEKFFGVAAMDALRHEFLQDTVRENAFLMDNYKVLHYSGNLDMIVNVPMTEAFLSSVPWSGQAEYKSSDLSPWRFGSDSAVGSFIKIKNFTRVIIWNSGHMVPYDQPEWALRMMERFIFDKPFVTNDVTPSYFTSDADDDSDEDLL